MRRRIRLFGVMVPSFISSSVNGPVTLEANSQDGAGAGAENRFFPSVQLRRHEAVSLEVFLSCERVSRMLPSRDRLVERASKVLRAAVWQTGGNEVLPL